MGDKKQKEISLVPEVHDLRIKAWELSQTAFEPSDRAAYGEAYALLAEAEQKLTRVPDFNPEAEAQDRAKKLFHDTWGNSALGKYNKKDWMDLQMVLHDLGVNV